MKELSLNILDISQNSITAGAKNISVIITEDTSANTFGFTITDDGSGMSEETVSKVIDPFYTSRKTRSVGLGLPFLKMQAELTGGGLKIHSRLGEGTTVEAWFKTDSIDFIPLGDIISTVCVMIQGAPDIDFLFSHDVDGKIVSLDTREIRAVLGDEISLGETEVIGFIETGLKEEYENQ